MNTNNNFTELALSFANAIEAPHFKDTSFKVNKKIFASLEKEKSLACIKLSKADQEDFCKMHKAIYPVNNHWGKSGWTYIELSKVDESILVEAVSAAYKEVSNKKTKS
jgi:predicted DNA-binding protein (MmcQ/YjbR family)